MFLPYNIYNIIQHITFTFYPTLCQTAKCYKKATSRRNNLLSLAFLTWRFGEEDLLLMILRFGRDPPLLSSDSVSQAELSRSWTLNYQQWVSEESFSMGILTRGSPAIQHRVNVWDLRMLGTGTHVMRMVAGADLPDVTDSGEPDCLGPTIL